MKICPDCSCDYLSHIETCAKCGAALISLEEHQRLGEEKQRCREEALKDPVKIREGDVGWMDELLHVLIDAGIPGRMFTDPGCKGGCRGNTCQLLVSRQDAPRAHGRIEEYFAEVHPEARVSQQMMSEGKCPACGTAVDPEAAECPDCGLAQIAVD